jgi:hypothetical protein
MDNVYTTSIGVPKRLRSKRVLGGDSAYYNNSVSTVQNNTTPPAVGKTPIDIVRFTASALPTVINYNTLYAPTHGQFPRIELIIDNGDLTRYRSQQQPQFTTITLGGTGTDDLIDTIYFELAEEKTGWIIIN